MFDRSGADYPDYLTPARQQLDREGRLPCCQEARPTCTLLGS